MHSGIKVIKWPHKKPPTKESVTEEMARHGYQSYEYQTCDPYFERSSHSHDYDEIRGAVEGTITFYFPDAPPITIEAGDILFIPAGVPHEVRGHSENPFSAFKGSINGKRSVTEHGDGRGSVESLKESDSYKGEAL